MERDLIKQLIEALAASDLAELEYSSNGETLRLAKRGAGPARPVPATTRPAPQTTPAAVPKQGEPPLANAIAAPLYGIVHLQQSPGAPPFIHVGQTISAGQVVCVIEAMKAFNQIRADRDGTVRAVLVASGDEVEVGQPLFELG